LAFDGSDLYFKLAKLAVNFFEMGAKNPASATRVDQSGCINQPLKERTSYKKSM
jgi:hypothetical protein